MGGTTLDVSRGMSVCLVWVTTVIETPAGIDTAKVILRPDASEEEWHAARLMGIGGSDAAAVVGISPWTSPYALWLRKTGQYLGNDVTLPMEVGTLLEDSVATLFKRRSPELIVVDHPGTLQHDDYPFMLVNLDRLIVDETGRAYTFLECKTCSVRIAEEWERNGQDIVPDHYVLQVQHAMAVTGFEYCYVAVLIGNEDFKIIRVDRDDELIDMLIQMEKEFWRMVQEGEPPDVDGSEDTAAILARMYDPEEDKDIELDFDLWHWVDEYKEACAAEKEVKARKTQASNVIKAAMGDAEVATIEGQKVVTWKSTKESTYTVTKPAGRQFRLTNKKGE